MTDPLLLEATRLLAERSGVTVPPYRRPLLAAELERLGRGDLERGLAAFRDGDLALVESIAGVFAVGETYLFRGPEHFRELRRLAARSAASGLPFNVLCAGVSTGEEAWSAVLVLAAVYESTDLPYCVVGWDLSRERLQRARLGRFGPWSTRSGFMGYDRYLVQTKDGYEVDPRLRRHAQFEHVNLVHLQPLGPPVFDAIFFRNVSMYWSSRQASEVAMSLGRRLAPDGRLFVGPSDPIRLPTDEWYVELNGSSFIYCRVEHPPPRPSERPPPARPLAPATATPRAWVRARADRGGPPPTRFVRPPSAPEPFETLAERVRSLADQGDHEQALELLAGRDPKPPDLLELEGIVHFSRGDLDAAIERFRAAAYWAPCVPTYAHWLELAISSREQRREAQGRCEQTGARP